MVIKKTDDSMPYTFQQTDKDMNTIIDNMLHQAQKTGKPAVLRFAKMYFKITPKMTPEQAQNAWKQAYGQIRGNYKIHSAKNAEEERIEKEPFDATDHMIYLRNIHRFYQICNQPQASEFICYWGKLMQLRMKEKINKPSQKSSLQISLETAALQEENKGELLTKEIVTETLKQAIDKTGVILTKPVMNSMLVAWFHGQKLGDILREDGSYGDKVESAAYIDLVRTIQSDKAWHYYEPLLGMMPVKEDKPSKATILRAARIVSDVLETPERITSFDHFVTETKDVLPGTVLQLRIPGMPIPSGVAWRRDPGIWKKYISEVCACARQNIALAGKNLGGKGSAEM